MGNRNVSEVLAIIMLLFGISEGLKFGTPNSGHEPNTHFGPPEPHYGPTDPPHTYKPPTHGSYPTEPPHTYNPIPHGSYPTEPPHTYKPPNSHYGQPEPHYGPTEPPHTYKDGPYPTEPPHTYKPPNPHYGPPEPHYGTTEPPHTLTPPTHGPHPTGHYSYATEPPKQDYDGCVDVSTYGEVKYHQVTKEHCEIEYKKTIHDRYKKVCDNVTSIACSVHPYTWCEMEMKNVTAYDCEWFWDYRHVKKCVNETRELVHYKMKPNCTTIPKYHCTEKWEEDEHGNLVWAGTGDCKLIEWEDCELVNVTAKIKWIEPNCNHTKYIPVHDIRPNHKYEMTSAMKCTVKKVTKCTPHTYEKCKYIHYTEAEIKPESVCVPYKIWVPHQERHHKQKCLFGKDKQNLPTAPLTGLQPGQSPNEVIRPIQGPSLKHKKHQAHH